MHDLNSHFNGNFSICLDLIVLVHMHDLNSHFNGNFSICLDLIVLYFEVFPILQVEVFCLFILNFLFYFCFLILFTLVTIFLSSGDACGL